MPRDYLSPACIARHEPAMRAQGVSMVARSPRGFLTAWKRAGGNVAKLSPYWQRRRAGFIARHVAQLEKRGEPLRQRVGRRSAIGATQVRADEVEWAGIERVHFTNPVPACLCAPLTAESGNGSIRTLFQFGRRVEFLFCGAFASRSVRAAGNFHLGS